MFEVSVNACFCQKEHFKTLFCIMLCFTDIILHMHGMLAVP